MEYIILFLACLAVPLAYLFNYIVGEAIKDKRKEEERRKKD